MVLLTASAIAWGLAFWLTTSARSPSSVGQLAWHRRGSGAPASAATGCTGKYRVGQTEVSGHSPDVPPDDDRGDRGGKARFKHAQKKRNGITTLLHAPRPATATADRSWSSVQG